MSAKYKIVSTFLAVNKITNMFFFIFLRHYYLPKGKINRNRNKKIKLKSTITSNLILEKPSIIVDLP